MTLKATLQDDLKAAQRQRDSARVSILRLVMAAIKQREVDERKELEDSDIQAVITKMIKQGRDAQQQFEEAGREELAAKERSEVAALEAYLPQMLDDDALAALVDEAIAASGAQSVRDMGQVMGIIKSRAGASADMAAASALVRAKLGNA